MFDPSYNKTATGFSTRIQPYSSPSSIHEKNGRNTGNFSRDSPQGKALSLKPSLPISSILLSVPVGEITRHQPSSTGGETRRGQAARLRVTRQQSIRYFALGSLQQRHAGHRGISSRKRTLYSLHLSPQKRPPPLFGERFSVSENKRTVEKWAPFLAYERQPYPKQADFCGFANNRIQNCWKGQPLLIEYDDEILLKICGLYLYTYITFIFLLNFYLIRYFNRMRNYRSFANN